MAKSKEQKRLEAAERQIAHNQKYASAFESDSDIEIRISQAAQRKLSDALKMPLSAPYLVQRATIVRPYVDMANTKLGDAVDLDYMGSSEFENGGTGVSLRVFQARESHIKQSVHPTITDALKRPLFIVHTFDDANLAAYNGYLRRLRGVDQTLRTKERTNFDQSIKNSNTDFWWDLQNHVFWSFDQHFMMGMIKTLRASWDFMNEKSAVAE